MTKNELLFSIAVDCVSYNENSEFKFHRVISRGEYTQDVERIYGWKRPHEDDFEDFDLYLKAERTWFENLGWVQKEVMELLEATMSFFSRSDD